ncbi:hypothetical protein PAPYR_3972 [Paratrimastix pyriformis]|uniref:Uncharacterized protein n=1 Tax=Paratrimastix pyriformis TaxID=342808 RepID=A0ABQ8UL27_9EUKA|nr:hypothetical protein PAPYR_3972 [Paratrimastix pyriformis]
MLSSESASGEDILPPSHSEQDTVDMETQPTQSSTPQISSVTEKKRYDYIDPPEESSIWRCPRCFSHFEHPLLLPCGHTVCESCVPADRMCPVCHTAFPVERLYPNLTAAKVVSRMRLKCPNCSQGCPAILAIPDLERHLHEHCEWRMSSCPRCQQPVIPHSLQAHECHQCPERGEPCVECGQFVALPGMERHRASECPKRLTEHLERARAELTDALQKESNSGAQEDALIRADAAALKAQVERNDQRAMDEIALTRQQAESGDQRVLERVNADKAAAERALLDARARADQGLADCTQHADALAAQGAKHADEIATEARQHIEEAASRQRAFTEQVATEARQRTEEAAKRAQAAVTEARMVAELGDQNAVAHADVAIDLARKRADDGDQRVVDQLTAAVAALREEAQAAQTRGAAEDERVLREACAKAAEGDAALRAELDTARQEAAALRTKLEEAEARIAETEANQRRTQDLLDVVSARLDALIPSPPAMAPPVLTPHPTQPLLQVSWASPAAPSAHALPLQYRLLVQCVHEGEDEPIWADVYRGTNTAFTLPYQAIGAPGAECKIRVGASRAGIEGVLSEVALFQVPQPPAPAPPPPVTPANSPLIGGGGGDPSAGQRPVPSGTMFPSSHILSPEEGTALTQFIGPRIRAAGECPLLWRGTRDGFDAATFHQLCDGNQGGTVTVVRSGEGNVFGGYASVAWNAVPSGDFAADPHAFLFVLRSQKAPGQAPIRIGQSGKHPELAVCCSATSGPIFGMYGLFVSDQSDAHTNSNTIFPHPNSTYAAPAGAPRYFINGGVRDFKIAEIEVFRCGTAP